MFEQIQKLNKDLRSATHTLSEKEVRFLVDNYYIIQENRKRAGNQVLAMAEEPHDLLKWFFDQNDMLERQLKVSLDVYTDSKVVGRWLKSVYGIGPVIAAGLLAHIDIKQCPTAGHIWRFAGYDPTSIWEKGKRRPWNAELKKLCWHVGQSFMKFSNRPDCVYGKLYRQRKDYEVARNERGDNVAVAAKLLPKFNPSTESYKHLKTGKLPPAQIDARARRWAVKIFLSHLHAFWWEQETGTKPVAPYPIAILGHAHMIEPATVESAK